VFGIAKAVTVPLLVFFFYPAFLFQPGSAWLIPATLFVVFLVYYFSFRFFIRIQDGTDEQQAGQ
jgi:phosphotransferase system  glucose/maltose/N-acetylglucosamine-specific IIC component